MIRTTKRWIRVAAKLLGVRQALDIQHNYIGNLITWTRPNVLGMIDRIRQEASASHIRAIARAIHFSEYMTYGVYVDYVVGLEKSGHFHDNSANLHLCWDYDLTSPDGLDRFFREIEPKHFGIMIHSKDGVPIESYRGHVQALWQAAE